MGKGRIEAFSDAVIAIAMTVMVLELRPPHAATLDALAPLVPIWIGYILSFLYLGIYWNNHHHLFQVAQRVDGAVLWANLFLLFWLSLVPFTTGWLGETGFAALPMAAYGSVLLMAALAYYLLVRSLIRCQPPGNALAEAIGADTKGKASGIAYVVGVPVALVLPLLAFASYVAVALVWVIPDRRMERAIGLAPDAVDD